MLRPAAILLLGFTVLTGFFYPLVVAGVAQALFPFQANGSLIEEHNRRLGSELIGQPFRGRAYFWSRPSATSPPYNGAASSGSNLGPTHPALRDQIQKRVSAVRGASRHPERPVPVDLVTASASGLDPHISIAGAEYQVERVAKARNVDASALRLLIAKYTEERFLGIVGEPRVHVLKLNLALDALCRHGAQSN